MTYYVYILTNNSRILYVGVTNDLRRRVSQHRAGVGGEFTRKYHVHQLVWCEHFRTPNATIATEKRIKSWNRAKKVALISKMNPKWDDLMPEATDDPDCHPDRAQRPRDRGSE